MVAQPQIGKREELADYIAVVDARSTPFISMAPKGKDIGNQTFSWQVDTYDAPKFGGVVDGTDVTLVADATSNASALRDRYSNYAQVFRRVHRTGFVAETSNVAGVGTSETARAVAKRLVELKRDMETTFTAVNQAAVIESSGTPTAQKTASLGAWLTSTNSAGIGAPVSGSQFVINANAITTTNSTALTESTVQGMLAGIYTNTGVYRDYDLLCGTALKTGYTNLCNPSVPISGGNTNTYPPLAGIRTFNKEISDQTLSSSIDIFEGDFGRLSLSPTTFIGWNSSGTTFTPLPYKGYIIPFDMVEVRYAKLPEVKDLPDAGGGPIKLIQAIAGLVVKNPAGFGMHNGAA